MTPKTAGSFRTVLFGEVLGKALTNHVQNSQHIGPGDFVFSKHGGSTLDPDVLRRDVLHPALGRLGIPRGTRTAGFHTFRHSVGSFINAETGNLKLAQKILGHSNLSTTADIYTHTSQESEREAALAVERAIYGNLFSTVLKCENKNKKAAIQLGKVAMTAQPVTESKKGASRSSRKAPMVAGAGFEPATFGL